MMGITFIRVLISALMIVHIGIKMHKSPCAGCGQFP